MLILRLTKVNLSNEEQKKIVSAFDHIIPKEAILHFQEMQAEGREIQLEQLFLLTLGILLLNSYLHKDTDSQIVPYFNGGDDSKKYIESKPLSSVKF